MEMVVTDKRVIFETGLIQRRTTETNISKIETVDVSQGVAGRAFGFGAVQMRGTGGSHEPLSWLVDPVSLRKAILVG